MSRVHRAAISVVCCVAVSGALLISSGWLRPELPSAEGPSDGRYQVSETLARQVQELVEREEGLRQSLWKNEVLAQAYGAVIESLWDQLRTDPGGLSLLEDLKFESVVWGKRKRVPDLRADIRVWRPVVEHVPPAEPFSWQEHLRASIAAGWELESSEFRHVRFDLTPNGLAKRSEFYCRASLSKKGQERVILEGPLFIDWRSTVDPIDRSAIERVDLSGLEVRVRSGECPFEVIIEEAIAPPRNAHAIDPLLVRDLDGDGKSEIILANRNLAFRMDAQGRYFATPLCTFPPGLISSAIFGDFDGDGSTDLLCTKHEGMVVLRGSERGVFDQREVLVWPNEGRLPYPMVLSS